MKQKPHALAVEIDRSMKLDLSNGQFEDLANFISKHEDSRKIMNELLQLTNAEVIVLIKK